MTQSENTVKAAPAKAPSPDRIRTAFETYARLMSAGDVEGIVALFAADATLEDPIGTPPHRGHDGIRAFFRNSFAGTGGSVEMALEGAVRVAGFHGAAAMRAHIPAAKQPIAIDTLDVMRFDTEGRIVSMTAYWGPTNLRPLG